MQKPELFRAVLFLFFILHSAFAFDEHSTPRVFIAATRQNDGKTTTSLGLIAALQKHFPRIGYIKPVGQRFVEIEEHKIDEDSVLMDSVYHLDCPLVDMSPDRRRAGVHAQISHPRQQ